MISKVAFRADSSSTIGTGHVQRCLTLANALKVRDVRSCFLCREVTDNQRRTIDTSGHGLLQLPDEGKSFSYEEDAKACNDLLKSLNVDWLVTDHYGLDCRWERLARESVNRIMVIDDLANRPHDGDLLLDQNFITNYPMRYDGLIGESCGRLLGPRYAILGTDYRYMLPQRLRSASGHSIVIYFGGADNFDLTLKAFIAAVTVAPTAKITVVLPKTNPQWPLIERLLSLSPQSSLVAHVSSLAELFAKNDVAIGACGTTTWERLCLGIPSVVVTLADNQLEIATTLHAQGLVNWIGRHTEVSTRDIADALQAELSRDDNVEFSVRCREIIDGQGTQRVVAALMAGRETPLVARPARWSDWDLLLEWANDPVTRKSGFSQAAIEETTHKKWFSQKLASETTTFLIVEAFDEVPIGTVRFEKEARGFEVHYSLASAFRRKGLGKPMLSCGLAKFEEANKVDVFGRVKETNQPSCAIFEQLGFKVLEKDSGVLTFIRSVKQG